LWDYICYVEDCELGFESAEEFDRRLDELSPEPPQPARKIKSTFGYDLPDHIDPELWGDFLMSRECSLPPWVREEIFDYLDNECCDPDELLAEAAERGDAYPIRWNDKQDIFDWFNRLRVVRAAGGGT